MKKQNLDNSYSRDYDATARKHLVKFKVIPYAVLVGGVVLSILEWQIAQRIDGIFSETVFPYSFLILGLSVTMMVVGLLFFYIKSYDWAVTIADANTRKINENMQELDKKVKIIEEKNRNLEKAKKTMMRLMQDISVEKNKIEEEKVKSEALLESIGDGMIATDKDEIIQVVNKAAEITLGCDSRELIGKSFPETIIVEDVEGKVLLKEELPVTKAMSTRQKITSSLTNSLFFVRNNKTKFPAYVVTTPVILKENMSGAIMVFRDISREWDIDRSKTEFVSLASHQLRTPLSTVGWYAEMLLAGDAGSLSVEQEDYVKEIYNGNQRMVELVNSLLNISRMELGNLAIESEATDFIYISKSVIKEMLPTIKKKKIKMTEKYGKDIHPINADTKLVRNIFQNLLNNAIKYTPEKGKIDIEITQKDPNIVIRVSDNGYGIPEHQKDRIFTKLFRADNAKEKETEGTGLGLYIVKLIVDAAKGKIWFESEENKGTTFYVAIPLSGMAEKKGTKSLVG